MAGQEAHAFVAKTRAQSEDFVRAELTAVQRLKIVFSVNMMDSYDHMFLPYKKKGSPKGAGRVSAGNWGGGGWVDFFFSGPKFPPRKVV